MGLRPATSKLSNGGDGATCSPPLPRVLLPRRHSPSESPPVGACFILGGLPHPRMEPPTPPDNDLVNPVRVCLLAHVGDALPDARDSHRQSSANGELVCPTAVVLVGVHVAGTVRPRGTPPQRRGPHPVPVRGLGPQLSLGPTKRPPASRMGCGRQPLPDVPGDCSSPQI